MSYSSELITTVKTQIGISENKLSEELGVTRQFIAQIRKEERRLSPRLAMLLAEKIELDPKLALLRLYKETIDDLETRRQIEELEIEYQRLTDAS
jgi:transcriptional regulator with XRE-family HTH domain